MKGAAAEAGKLKHALPTGALMISAIVPVWNGRDLLVRLLDTLDAQTLPARNCWWWITGPRMAHPTRQRARRAGDRAWDATRVSPQP